MAACCATTTTVPETAPSSTTTLETTSTTVSSVTTTTSSSTTSSTLATIDRTGWWTATFRYAADGKTPCQSGVGCVDVATLVRIVGPFAPHGVFTLWINWDLGAGLEWTRFTGDEARPSSARPDPLQGHDPTAGTTWQIGLTPATPQLTVYAGDSTEPTFSSTLVPAPAPASGP